MVDKYNKLTPRLALNLAAPHTWPASIFPVLLAVCVACANHYEISTTLSIVLLLIAVLLQSAVNTLNDYFDFKKGLDSESDNVEESDSVLVYNQVNPKSALWLAVSFVVVALLFGVYCIYESGFFCLVIALIGIIVLGLYSGGKTPISYLPIGEVVSGFVMGGLITYASYNVLTLEISPWILCVSIPLIIDIALIMLTNNTCDIEKDTYAGRKTLPVLIGRKNARGLYKALVVASYVSVLVICAIWFRSGLLVYPFLLLVSFPVASRLMALKLDPESRIFSMGQVATFNIVIGGMYCLAVVASCGNLII